MTKVNGFDYNYGLLFFSVHAVSDTNFLPVLSSMLMLSTVAFYIGHLKKSYIWLVLIGKLCPKGAINMPIF